MHILNTRNKSSLPIHFKPLSVAHKRKEYAGVKVIQSLDNSSSEIKPVFDEGFVLKITNEYLTIKLKLPVLYFHKQAETTLW